MPHANIRNNQILDFNCEYLDEDIERIETTEEMYNAYLEDKNKVIYQDGAIIFNPDYDKIQLEKAKSDKITENDKLRDEALNAGVEYKDILFDSDTDQKVNLLATVSAMGEEDTITWFGMDNQPLECTVDDLQSIGGLITQLHSYCWNKNAQIKLLISEAEKIEDLEHIEIDYNFQPAVDIIDGSDDGGDIPPKSAEEPSEEPSEGPEESEDDNDNR